MAADNVAEILQGMGTMLTEAMTKAAGTAPAAPAAVAPAAAPAAPAAPTAVDGSVVLSLQKSVNDLSAKVDLLTGILMPAANGQEGGPVMKAITGLNEDTTTIKEVMSAALDRLSAVESGQVMRKAAGGDETEPPTPMNKTVGGNPAGVATPGMWDTALRSISGPSNRGKPLMIV